MHSNYYVTLNLHSVCFSFMSYRIGKYRTSYFSSAGLSGKAASPYHFNPVNSHTYIGLNTRYASTSTTGSGVCRMYCSTSSAAAVNVLARSGEQAARVASPPGESEPES